MYTKTEIALAKKNGVINELYEDTVNRLIRKEYTVSRELAILRQRDTKPEEFNKYNAYAEKCKAEAKKALEI
jgi:hypothetical protein